MKKKRQMEADRTVILKSGRTNSDGSRTEGTAVCRGRVRVLQRPDSSPKPHCIEQKINAPCNWDSTRKNY